MRIYILIILTVSPIILLAQQSAGYITHQIGNVTVRFFTGPDSEEINNAKIIGQYAVILSDSMDYEKPILLDFIHEYDSHHEETSSCLSYGADEYKKVGKHGYTVPSINEKKKIIIRQFGFHFDVAETMKLLYYALNNQSQVQNLSRRVKIFRDSNETIYRLFTILIFYSMVNT